MTEQYPGQRAVTSEKPNCYDCKFRNPVLGSAHSCCGHPSAGGKDALGRIMAIFAGVGRAAPTVDVAGAKRLNIEASPHGVCRGWFNWPYDYDPTWLLRCDGFEPKKPKESVA